MYGISSPSAAGGNFPFDENLFAYYSLDAPEIIDNSGNNNSGIPNIELTEVGGVSGKGKKFEGDKYIALDFYFQTVGVLVEFTFCFWTNNATNGCVYSLDGNEYFEINIVDGEVEFISTDSQGVKHTLYSGKKINVDENKFVECKFDSAQPLKSIKIDNVTYKSEPAHNGNNIGSGATRYAFIGIDSFAEDRDGSKGSNYLVSDMIDEIRFYSKFLSEGGDAALYNYPSGPGAQQMSALQASLYDTAEKIKGDIYEGKINSIMSDIGYDGVQYDLFINNEKIDSSTNTEKLLGNNSKVILKNSIDAKNVGQYSRSGQAIDVDDEYIYIGCNDNVVRKVDKNNNIIWEFKGHNETVVSLSVDNDGYVYTGTGGLEDALKRITPDGYEDWSIAPNSYTYSCVRAEHDGPYVFVSHATAVEKINKIDGSTADSVGVYSQVLHIDDDYVYSEGESYNFHKFDKSLNEVFSIVPWENPVSHISSDSNLNIYISSTERTVIRVLDENGNFKYDIDVHGSSYPDADGRSLYIDKYDNVYSVHTSVICHKNNIVRWTESLNELSVVLDKNGFVYVFGGELNILEQVVSDTKYQPKGVLKSTRKNIGFKPAKIYATQIADIPQDEDIQFIVRDDNGNSIKITQSDVDNEVDTNSSFTSSTLRIECILTSSDQEDTPTLSRYAIYYKKFDTILSGPLSNRPSPGTKDRLYYATDDGYNGTWYYDNGSSWEVHVRPNRVRSVKRNSTGAVVFASAGDTRGTNWVTTTATNPTHTLSLASTPMNFAKGGVTFNNTVTNGQATLQLQTTGGSVLASTTIQDPSAGNTIQTIASFLNLTNIQCKLQCTATTGTFTSLTQYLSLNEETTLTFS